MLVRISQDNLQMLTQYEFLTSCFVKLIMFCCFRGDQTVKFIVLRYISFMSYHCAIKSFYL